MNTSWDLPIFRSRRGSSARMRHCRSVLCVPLCSKVGYSDQIVSRCGECEHRINTLATRMPEFVKTTDGFHPAENFLHPFANSQTYTVAFVSGGSAINSRLVYEKRKQIVEPVFGQIKEARRFRRFSFLGIKNVAVEWDLVCLTHNLLKLYRSGWQAN